MIGDDAEKAQAIIVAGFLIAIGIVAIVVLLNSAVLSVSEQPDTTESDVDAVTNYRSTIVTESREALIDVNDIAAEEGLNNSEVNQTYVDYVNQINERMQEVYASEGLVGIENIAVNGSFSGEPAWRVRKNRTTPPTELTRDPIDVVFVLDTSGSMGGSKLDEAQTETKSFVNSLKPLDKAAVVSFDDDSGYDEEGLYQPLTVLDDEVSRQSINDTVDELDADGQTYLGGGIREAVDELKLNSSESRRKVIIALADGANTGGWLHYPNKYIEYNDYYNDWRHEWVEYGEDICLSDEYGGSSNCLFPEPDLDDRDITQAQRANRTGATIYTVGFGSDAESGHLIQVADETGNGTANYYSASTGALQDAFDKILEDITEAEPIASGIDSTYRMGVNVTDFPGQGNVTLRVNNNSSANDLLWRMQVTNLSSSHPSPNHVIVEDGSNNVLQRYNYETLGGPPVDINVMRDTINGYGRNMSKQEFTSVGDYNSTLEYSASVANVTYDIRVDDAADPSTPRCSKPPCANTSRQTVGSIHNVSFDITYRSGNVNYSEDINLQTNPVDQAADVGGSPAPSPSSPVRTLNFSTPVYDYKTYYPFDQDGGDGWSDDIAFDASGNNNSMGLQPSPPIIGNESAHGNDEGHSYYFNGDQYTRDRDGWNNIPIDGTGEPQMFSISLWFRDSKDGLEDGTLIDTSNYDDDRPFRLYIEDGDVVWRYEDEDGKRATAEAEIPSGVGGGPPPWVPAPISDDKWHYVTAIGGWNNNRTLLYVADDDGVEVGANSTAMGGKPIQEELGDGRLGEMTIGASYDSTGFSPVEDGYQGRIDDVRIYHRDVSRLSPTGGEQDLIFGHDFESGKQGWETPGDAGWGTDGSNSYLYTDDSQVVYPDDPDDLDLDGYAFGTLSFEIQPEDTDYYDLQVEYYDDSGNWVTAGTYDADDNRFEYCTGFFFPTCYTVFDEASVTIPSDGMHSNAEIRFNAVGATVDDSWRVDNVQLTAREPTGSINLSADPGFIDDIYNDTQRGYVTTQWKNFREGVDNYTVDHRSLTLTDVDAERNGGEISMWVQALDNDTGSIIESDPIQFDGNTTYDLQDRGKLGNLENEYRFRLKVAVNHTDPTDHPKFYDAQLEAS
jgi:uncharacterized protein YoxC